MENGIKLDRRNLLQSGLLGLSALAVPTPLWASSAPSKDTLRKFFANGQVAPFHGNTILCHLDQQGLNSGTFDALLDIYREVPATSFADKLTLLPPSSYHMTIFVGANDPIRTPGLWPNGVALDAPMAECSRIMAERLQSASIGVVAPIRMRVDTSPPRPDTNPLTIRLLPLDDAEDRKLRQLRDRLSEILGIRALDHERYRFHVTIAYKIRKLDRAEHRDFLSRLADWQAMVSERSPVITLGQPEFCILDDMFAFHRQFYLS